jgi:20S proteasome subunit beta 2
MREKGSCHLRSAMPGLIQSQLELLRLNTGTDPRVITAKTRLAQRLFQYQGHISAALVLGGIDATGSHLYTVWPHGSANRLPYATMGSGSLAAMSVFESLYTDDMDEKAAINLVDEAIQAGIWNDLGSGGNVDICVISKTKGVNMMRNYRTPNQRIYETTRQAAYAFPRGTTEWFRQTNEIFENQIDIEKVAE